MQAKTSEEEFVNILATMSCYVESIENDLENLLLVYKQQCSPEAVQKMLDNHAAEFMCSSLKMYKLVENETFLASTSDSQKSHKAVSDCLLEVKSLSADCLKKLPQELQMHNSIERLNEHIVLLQQTLHAIMESFIVLNQKREQEKQDAQNSKRIRLAKS